MTARVPRRALFGGSAGMLAMFGLAGASKAAEVDGPLLDLVAELEAVQADIDVMNADSTQDIDSAFDAALADFWEIADELVDIPARTPEGLRAKAKALGLVYRSLGESVDSHVGRHLLGLVRDMTGDG